MIPKFRVWEHDVKFMNDQVRITYNRFGDNKIFVEVTEGVGWKDVDEKYLMQSTGMFDKNKNEIYEGDVVNITGIYDHKIMCEVVEYCKRGAYYDVGSFMLGNFETHHIEIIGNIHEHPELLNQPKQ